MKRYIVTRTICDFNGLVAETEVDDWQEIPEGAVMLTREQVEALLSIQTELWLNCPPNVVVECLMLSESEIETELDELFGKKE